MQINFFSNELTLYTCRFVIEEMQSVCLDEFGGEKALDLSSQGTTLIQHIFGGYLQTQAESLLK